MREFCQGIIFTFAVMIIFILLCGNALAGTDGQSQSVYWVNFKDKPATHKIEVSPRALARRTERAFGRDLSSFDVPVYKEYLDDLKNRGLRIRQVSRWLNAASVEVEPELLPSIRQLHYVKSVTRVSSYSRPRSFLSDDFLSINSGSSVFDYGPSWDQIHMIMVDSLHNLGLTGNGITIGVMDTGFDTSHVVFDHLKSENRIIATYDFINHDSNVVDQPDVQRTHGTEVLSILAGFAEGSLIGPAFESDIILAKTEIANREVQAEEDNWIVAAEWMESLGVDIISSSLGYIDWYDTTQLDGQTAAITIAAETAASLGVVVVNAAGNEGDTFWRKVIPPADGDSVIAIGAVNSNGDIALFSSHGPTADSRIKPDFCAQGVSVHLASWFDGYGSAGGTSFATPLIAGGIALLLEGHPNWTLSDIFSSLKNASSHRYLPNNTYGWGVPDFTAAYYGNAGTTISGGPGILIAPHPAIDSVVFYLTSEITGSGELSIHDLGGFPVIRIPVTIENPGTSAVVWSGKNESGNAVASGIYIGVFALRGEETIEKFCYISDGQ